MKICENCKREINKNEKLYKNLCLECYKEYLYEKIENMTEDNTKTNTETTKKGFWFFKKKK